MISALEVFTYAEFPEEFIEVAAAYAHLTFALVDTRYGGVDEALGAQEALLPHLQPGTQRWFYSHHCLGGIYRLMAWRSNGERKEAHLRAAIHHYEEALSVPSVDPALRAETSVQCAYALIDLDDCPHDEILERSREHLKDALEVYTPTEYPKEYLSVMRVLAKCTPYAKDDEPPTN
jgi:hypothetical protein